MNKIKYFKLLLKKIKFLLSKETAYSSFTKEITMGKCKTKAIQTDLGTFRNNQAYPIIIYSYSGIFKTLCNPSIFRIVIYPEP